MACLDRPRAPLLPPVRPTARRTGRSPHTRRHAPWRRKTPGNRRACGKERQLDLTEVEGIDFAHAQVLATRSPSCPPTRCWPAGATCPAENRAPQEVAPGSRRRVPVAPITAISMGRVMTVPLARYAGSGLYSDLPQAGHPVPAEGDLTTAKTKARLVETARVRRISTAAINAPAGSAACGAAARQRPQQLVTHGERAQVLRAHVELAQTPDRDAQGAGHGSRAQLAHADLRAGSAPA